MIVNLGIPVGRIRASEGGQFGSLADERTLIDMNVDTLSSLAGHSISEEQTITRLLCGGFQLQMHELGPPVRLHNHPWSDITP